VEEQRARAEVQDLEGVSKEVQECEEKSPTESRTGHGFEIEESERKNSLSDEARCEDRKSFADYLVEGCNTEEIKERDLS